MKTKIKRFISVLLSCTVLVFSCIFIPHQKAEAGLLLAGGVALGTAVAIGLIGYGIAVSSDDPAEDEYLGMACDKLTEYAAGQGINKWNLYNYLTNATWFWSAMANVAAWFYEQNLVFNEVYEPMISGNFYLDNAAYEVTLGDSVFASDFIDYDGGTARYWIDKLDEGECLYYYLSSDSVLYAIGSQQLEFSRFYFDDTVGAFNNYYFSVMEYTNGLPYFEIDGNLYYYQKFGTIGGCDYNVYMQNFLHYIGITLTPDVSGGTLKSFVESVIGGTVEPTGKLGIDFPRKLFDSPADVLDITGSMESYKIDSTKDVIDFGNAEELTELKTFDATLEKVLSGELTADQVITSVGAQPYVLTDAETGEIATTDTPAENVKPVALEGDLSIPKDLVAEDTYTPTNTDTDTDKPKTRFNFPLSQFFPFCLPFDLYDFLTFFVADPVAPVFEMDLSSMFSADPDIYDPDSDYTITIDLSKFDEVAELLRVLETIGIIVGFVLVSRKLIHGGN